MIPELNASSRLAAAEARIRELDALVAEARSCIGDLMLSFDPAIGEKGTRIPDHQVDRVKDWLARTAPKEQS